MSEQKTPLTIVDLKRGTQLIDPEGWIIVIEGSNATGMCIVKPLDGKGASISIPITDLNADGYKVHLRPEASDSINFYDIFDGLIIENKDGTRLTIQELSECKVVVESEKGNLTVTSLEELKNSEYYLLKPEQKPQDRIIVLNLEGDTFSILCVASNVIEFGYNFLNIRKFSLSEGVDHAGGRHLKEIDNFIINYERINNFKIFETLEEALVYFDEITLIVNAHLDREKPDGK